MMSILLSDKSLDLLKKISESSTACTNEIDSSFDDAILQLLEYRFIENPVINWDVSSKIPSPIAPNYKITEYGKGYLKRYNEEEKLLSSIKSMSDSAKQQANSAEIQAHLAVQKSRKADIKGWIAIIISVIALLIEFASNYEEIMNFIKAIF